MAVKKRTARKSATRRSPAAREAARMRDFRRQLEMADKLALQWLSYRRLIIEVK